jgi:tRNA(fMet)-specific endonuclease VapC
MNYLLDTNVISELIAKQPQLSVVDWIDAQDPNSIYLSKRHVTKYLKQV